MNRIPIILLLILVISCKNESANYVTLSGKIENPDPSRLLRIYSNNYEKEIDLNTDGTFKDTLLILNGEYNMNHGNEYGSIYLKNGFITSFTANYEDFDKSLIYSGDGSEINNFSIQTYLVPDAHITEDLFETGTEEDLDNALQKCIEDYENLKAKYKNIDSIHILRNDKSIENSIVAIKNYFTSKKMLKDELPIGSSAPNFTNYQDYNGGTTSLSDLTGKFLYIDIWATWCNPCLAEIPSIKKLESQLKGKNIELVSISVDDGRGYNAESDDLALAASIEGWKKMIKDKDLGGRQLLANAGWESDFIREFKIKSIPRYIILDPKGNIINPDAPRPSNPNLINILKDLGI